MEVTTERLPISAKNRQYRSEPMRARGGALKPVTSYQYLSERHRLDGGGFS
jgi:hypothetical protein